MAIILSANEKNQDAAKLSMKHLASSRVASQQGGLISNMPRASDFCGGFACL